MVVECNVPSWFTIVHDYWQDNIIDIDTFINALNYLLNNALAICYNVEKV